ncbi:unnamed protein product [Brachionus calyciflorus]|uniref:DNA mismatch repair protein MSH2 n=1 Tax=Brachionus calyciflorus TaxID=104777 RepID=A0A813LV93_9BILA|nr:unnamed protein product [Brachionus calyciflorus]
MSNTLKQHSTEPIQDKEFLSAYKRLPEKSAATIRFFDRGEYFSLHGSDAVFAAREFFKTNNVIKIWKSDNNELETCYVKNNNFEIFLKDLLLVKQYRVEIWKKSNKSGEWTMINHGSPGNLSQFEDILYSGEESPSSSPITDPGLLAIQINTEDNINKLNCGFVDKTSRSFLVCTIAYKDNFTDLESLLIHLGPKECLIPASGGNRDFYTKLDKVLVRNNILVTERKKSDFNADNECSELNTLIKTKNEQNVANFVELKDKNSVGCLNALIKYLELLQDPNNEKNFKIISYNLNNYLKLDSGAFRSLNLLPNRAEQNSNKTHSVYGVLNRCCTMQGQRLLTQWIKQPLVDIHKIEERQNLVEILVNDSELRQNLVENYLKKMPDFQRIEWRFLKNKANLQDCYKIYCAVNNLPSLFECLLNHEGERAHLIKEMFINPLNAIIMDFKKFQVMIESTLDLDQIKNHLFLVKSSYKPELEELREKLDRVEEKIESLADKVSRDLGLSGIKLESNAQSGYYFRVPRKDDKVVSSSKEYTVIETRKDGIKFQNAKLQDLNEDFIRIKDSYEQEQKGVVDDIIKISCGYLDALQNLNNLVSELDIYVSFSLVALSSQAEYIRPKLHPMGTGILKLKEARHPCLELQEGINFIPNDCEFIKDEKTFCIITGPNMGGKSTYIRQIGVLVLMAQIGSFVPASSAELSIVDCILARIGANDCQNKGVSTFMAEMLETSFILKTATSNSLVIIDELGRGTSTYDGFGLAWAISDYLVKKVKCFTLFATHFHELTALSEELKTVYNSHVSAMTTDDSLTLLYKVKPGVCDQSFGIHVARLANFPEHVIEYAKEKAKYLEDYCPILPNEEENAQDHSKKYKYKQETDEIINQLFQKIEKIDKNSFSDEEYIQKVQELIHSEAKIVDNPYFKALISRL